ncbi:MAG TPA: beta-ketoacyl synthase chain length factor, partial [Gammaproteobacteria bacterium]|nr:beta-ketoacyl synthase chain length factor [Gammaproteobacteria bacterium]
PTSFSLSVHNSIVGLYSMARQDTAATTVIAAGSDTLPQALIEAAGCLHRQHPEVLLVYADDELPADYAADLEQSQPCIALALLLRADKTPLRLQVSYTPQESDAPNKAATTHALNHPAAGLLDLLQNRKKTAAHCSTDRYLWQFECHG